MINKISRTIPEVFLPEKRKAEEKAEKLPEAIVAQEEETP